MFLLMFACDEKTFIFSKIRLPTNAIGLQMKKIKFRSHFEIPFCLLEHQCYRTISITDRSIFEQKRKEQKFIQKYSRWNLLPSPVVSRKWNRFSILRQSLVFGHCSSEKDLRQNSTFKLRMMHLASQPDVLRNALLPWKLIFFFFFTLYIKYQVQSALIAWRN